MVNKSDPEGEYFLRPIEFVRLPCNKDETPLVVAISEAPGPNYLRELIEFGPNVYKGVRNAHGSSSGTWEFVSLNAKRNDDIPLQSFLDFAVGAAGCCEILHHQNGVVHGELRGDAFHFNREKGK